MSSVVFSFLNRIVYFSYCDYINLLSLVYVSMLYQNIMPISAAMFRSERNNPVPQCPPRLEVQMLTPVIWSRMPNHFLNPEVGRVSERLGWMVECTEPLIMMALHIPEENRLETVVPVIIYHWIYHWSIIIIVPCQILVLQRPICVCSKYLEILQRKKVDYSCYNVFILFAINL